MHRPSRPRESGRPLMGALAGILLSTACAPRELPAPTLLMPDSLTALVSSHLAAPQLMAHAAAIVEHERASGSEGETAATDYVITTLQEAGIEVDVLEYQGYTSTPDSARLEVVGGAFHPAAITLSFSAGAESLQAPLVDVGSLADLPALEPGTGERLVIASGARARLAPALATLNGKIALVTGQPRGVPTLVLEALGAAGVVFVNPEERLNDLIVTTTWGNPSLLNSHRLPRIPVLEVSRSAGDTLRTLLAASPGLPIQMSTWVRTRWVPLRIPVARIRPESDPDAPYVLFGGHLDAWYHGGTDEGASNAAMLALALDFQERRADLRRGLVVAWWPGHSTGRYSGSTWFADERFNDLRREALAYVNVDGIGQMGATRLGAVTTASLAPLAVTTLEQVGGQVVEPSRPGRNSDQSFNGVGLPLLQINHSRPDSDGGYWWWHTPDDTFDKIDAEVLLADTRLYAAALSELLNAPIYPVDLVAQTDEIRRVLELRAREADHRFSLDEPAARLEALREKVGALSERLTVAAPDSEIDLALVRILRPLHRVLYVPLADHHPDPGLGEGLLPGLSAVQLLASEPETTNRYRFAQTSLLRERNRLIEALDQATDEVDRLLATLPRETTP